MSDLDKFFPIVLQGICSNASWAELKSEAVVSVAMMISIEAAKQYHLMQHNWDAYRWDVYNRK